MKPVSRRQFWDYVNPRDICVYCVRTEPETVTEFKTRGGQLIGKAVTRYDEDPNGAKEYFMIDEVAKVQTVIFSNGSKWAGEEPDDVEVLKVKLERHTLDPRLAPFIQTPEQIEFIQPRPELEGMTCFSGNFFDVSSVFSIYTNDPVHIAELTQLIGMNMESPAYKHALEVTTEAEEKARTMYTKKD